MTGRLPVMVLGLGLLAPVSARAGFTETLPARTFLLDERLSLSRLGDRYDNRGERAGLADDIDRYEPSGGYQGTINVDAVAEYTVLINQLGYGITDRLSVLFAMPVALERQVKPRLGWTEGSTSQTLGRPYSEDDFWQWAGSMGQDRPRRWHDGASLCDTVLGGRWRFADDWDALRERGLRLALSGFATLPTGEQPDPEEVAAAGTTAWDLQAQGELGLHLGGDARFPGTFDDRVTLGLDVFVEAFLPHTYTSGTGAVHPLLTNNRGYVGTHYRVDPGDYLGAQAQLDLVVFRGEARDTWIAEGPAADALPPLATLSVRYNFTRTGQGNWTSDSPAWDYKREREWRPGFKTYVAFDAVLSGLRLGIPAELVGSYRDLTWIAGRNTRAPRSLAVGIRVPAQI